MSRYKNKKDEKVGSLNLCIDCKAFFEQSGGKLKVKDYEAK